MKSVTDVAQIADPLARLTAAAELARTAEAKADALRTKRDLAVLTMLRPFADAVAPTNAARARLRAELDAGKITDDEYENGLTENREQRRRDIEAAKVEVFPVDVYKMLGVARSLVNRILMRMPNDPLPVMRNPEKVAKASHDKIPEWEAVVEQAREIRNKAALDLMTGENDTGVYTSNADIARATHLTTARVAQIREGAR